MEPCQKLSFFLYKKFFKLSNSPEKGFITAFEQEFSEHIPYLTRLTTENKTKQNKTKPDRAGLMSGVLLCNLAECAL